MPRSRLPLEPTFAFVVLLLFGVPAAAQWIPNGTPLCIQPGDQTVVRVISAGAGGMIATWTDSRGGASTDIYAQCILPTGAIAPGWPANGLAVCAAAGIQSSPAICGDGAGGAFVTWQDLRGGGNYDVYVQRITAAGTIAAGWPADGVAISAAPGDQLGQSILSDGAGGAIVSWTDSRSGNKDIYAARIDGSGALLPGWAVNGNPVCSAAADQRAAVLATDGANGAVIAWTDNRNGLGDIYALRVLANGAIALGWSVNGNLLCNAGDFQIQPAICSDGGGGAFVSWRDNRSGVASDIYATRVDAGGAIAAGWPLNGAPVVTAPGEQFNGVLCPDGSGGMIIEWEDYRNGATDPDIYATHFTAAGAIVSGWAVDGNPIAAESDKQIEPDIAADGLGGAFMSWCNFKDYATDGIDLYATHMTGAGVPAPGMPPNGFPLVALPGHQVHPKLAVISPGVAMTGWWDKRSGDWDVYGMLLGANVVFAESPGACLTSPDICAAVPFNIMREDSREIRGYSVTFTVSSNLALCAGTSSISEGNYLSDVNTTFFQVVDNGGASYTVDCIILGDPCGAAARNGNLFNVNVQRVAGPDGVGTVTITNVNIKLRDCNNDEMVVVAGTPAQIGLASTSPVAVSDLAAAQVTSGNDADGTTRIRLTWSPAPEGSKVSVYRAGFGNYPSYDDPPAAGSLPGIPSYPPPAPWVITGVTASGVTDEVPVRDFYYYVAFVTDPCGNRSAVSNMTGGTLNYFLGDVHNGINDCAGNNLVNTSDVSFLGAHYGISAGPGSPYACLDVGPTTDLSVNGRPTTDGVIDFEDAVLFGLNYGLVSAPQARAVPAAEVAHDDRLAIDAPEQVDGGATFSARILLHGSGDLHGISTKLSWDRTVVEPVSLSSGGMIESQGGVMLSPGPGAADAVLLGVRERGITGDGVIASVGFRALRAGGPKIGLAAVKARDASNHPVAVAPGAPLPSAGSAPGVTTLDAVSPNPFRELSTLGFSLALRGAVELAIYSVDGRRVRTLARDTREPGRYRVAWDALDEQGRRVHAGVYFARLVTPEHRFTRTLVLTR